VLRFTGSRSGLRPITVPSFRLIPEPLTGVLWALAAAALAVLVGAAVATGQPLVAALPVGVLLLAGMRSQSGTATPFQVSFWVVGLALFLITLNGIRLAANVTIADAVLVLAAIMLAYGLLVRPQMLSHVPTWLLVAAGGLFLAALLAEAFPPSHLSDNALRTSQQSLYYGITQGQIFPTQEQAIAANMSFAVRLVGTLLFLPLIIGLVCTTWRRVTTLVNVWLAGAAINAAVATLAVFHVVDLQVALTGQAYSTRAPGEQRLAGLTVHPTALSMICALAVPVVLTRMTVGKRVRYGALLALLMTGILVSGSRAGLVAAPATLVLLVLLQRRLRVRTAIIGLIGGTGIIAIGLSSGLLLTTVNRLTGADWTGSESDVRRIASYHETLHEIIGRPIIGHGFEVIRGAHNIVLELLHAGGIIALVAFAIFVIGTARTGFRLGRDPRLPPDMQLLANALTASLWVWILTALVANLISDRYLYVPAGLILGLYFVRIRSEMASADRAPPAPVPAPVSSPRAPEPVNRFKRLPAA
jgi:O-Antigen ligase